MCCQITRDIGSFAALTTAFGPKLQGLSACTRSPAIERATDMASFARLHERYLTVVGEDHVERGARASQQGRVVGADDGGDQVMQDTIESWRCHGDMIA